MCRPSRDDGRGAATPWIAQYGSGPVPDSRIDVRGDVPDPRLELYPNVPHRGCTIGRPLDRGSTV